MADYRAPTAIWSKFGKKQNWHPFDKIMLKVRKLIVEAKPDGQKNAFVANVISGVACTHLEMAWIGINEAEIEATGRKVENEKASCLLGNWCSRCRASSQR